MTNAIIEKQGRAVIQVTSDKGRDYMSGIVVLKETEDNTTSTSEFHG